MYVEAICPLCFASHVVPEDMRGEALRCEECEEEFVISKKAKRTNKKPSKLREVKPAEEGDEAEVTPVEAAEVADVLPDAALAKAPPKKPKPRAEDEEVLDIPDDAVQGGAPVVKTTPAPKRRRDEDEEEARPKKKRRDDDEEDDDRPRRRPARRGGPSAGLVVGLSAGVVVLLGLCAGGGWWVFFHDDEAKQVAVHDPVKPIQNPPPPPKAEPPKPQPPKEDPPKQDPPKVNPPVVRPPKVDPPKPDPALPWSVKADPPANPVKLPADFTKEIAAPGTFGEVTFPTGPSPVVVVGSNATAGDQREVWNLETGKMNGKVVGTIQGNPHPVVSPDGAHLAFLMTGARRGQVEVWAPASGKVVTAQAGSTFSLELLEFAGTDGLLIGRRNGANMTVKVIDPASGRDEHEFTTPRPSGGRDAVAVSPGGAYLALIDRENLQVYEVKTGALAGQRPVPKAARGGLLTCRGLSFSPDGGELAALLFGGAQAQLVCWDAAKGDVLLDAAVPKAQPQPGWLAVYRGHAIDWVGDRRGWLLYGYTFVDRTKNGAMTALAEPAPFGSPLPRHMVGPAHIATVAAGAKPTERTLAVRAFDPDKPQ